MFRPVPFLLLGGLFFGLEPVISLTEELRSGELTDEPTCTVDGSCSWSGIDDVQLLKAKIAELHEQTHLLREELDSTIIDESQWTLHRQKEIREGFQLLTNQGKVGVDAVELMRMFYKMFFNKERQKPIFLITYGPPGSGKSWILDRVAKNYNYDIEANFVKVLQDDMMKSIGAYNQEMDDLNKTRSQYLAGNNELSSEYFDKANDVYWKYRNMINQMKKMLLDVAYRQELNIVYETTGSKRDDNPSSTLFNIMKEAKSRGYICVLTSHQQTSDFVLPGIRLF
mmetsp:Transcript_16111/g.28969  ORF Transcript_16111/g.28969 Transcript_16111/m.28969 type:complete len:283 (-) Transcript_16111:657-1505(-)